MTPTEEREQASAIDVEARTKALVDKGIIGNGSQAPAGRKRATRSDAGTKRAPKAEPGQLTKQQGDHINKLYGIVGAARLDLQDCEIALSKAADVFAKAEFDYFNYLREITAK